MKTRSEKFVSKKKFARFQKNYGLNTLLWLHIKKDSKNYGPRRKGKLVRSCRDKSLFWTRVGLKHHSINKNGSILINV